MRNLINILLFQAGWFAAVLGGAKGMPLLGTLLVVALVAIHLARSPLPGDEFVLIATAGLLGALFDSALASTGWVVYASGQLAAGTAPYWIVAMWVLFATTLNVSLRWLKGRWLLASLLGAAGGPLAYFAGARLGGLEFGNMAAGLSAIGFGWAILMPVLMSLSNRFDGWSPRREAPVLERQLVGE